jgi:D-aminoacyl-tRNA deacylase
MYEKYLVIASKKDKAGINITTNLSQFRQNPVLSSMQKATSFDFYLVEEEIVSNSGLNHEKISKYDFVIFASKHKAESGEKSLSIHAPGNWRTAELGGQDNKVCPTSALFQKQAFEILRANVGKYDLDDYKVTLEVTHHGPLIDKPCMFIEIGSSENEWVDRRAGFVIAKTISDIIRKFKPNPYREVAIGIGGPHYCPNFNKLQLKSNIALSHIIPGYMAPITDQMIKEAISKTQEEVDFAVLDWKGLSPAEERQKVIDILEKNYINWKKTSDIEK